MNSGDCFLTEKVMARGVRGNWLVLMTIAGVLAATGCGSPANVKQLQNQNKNLEQRLQQADKRISDLQARERLLKNDVDELNRVISVLGTEKTVRVEESSKLRGEVRRFVQQQVDALKDFLVLGDLLDYVGGELVERQQEDDKPLLLVDFANPIPRDGTLTGVGARLSQPVEFTVKIMRPLQNKLVVVWESKPVVATQAGISRFNFPVAVGVEKGDVIAYHFAQSTPVSFDSGTGDTRYSSKNVGLGGALSPSALSGESQRRAYSIGVYGLLN